MRGQRGFDLTRFDAKAADLDLVVEATEKLEIPIASETCCIASAIHTRSWIVAKRIRDEFFSGEIRFEQVTARQIHSANTKSPATPIGAG